MPSVLVVVIYTDFKYYARPLYPKAFNDIDYPNKTLLFVDENNFPAITTFDSGDILTAEGRAFGIEKAIEGNFDYVFFLDIDAIPDPDILTKLTEDNTPFIGGTIACRGNADKIIGHTYKNYENKERVDIPVVQGEAHLEVMGISGALMLVHKSIFTLCDYKGYRGVNHYPNRTTCDDEFYCLQVYEKTGIKPILHLGAKAWHLHDDGKAYRYRGEVQPYTREKNAIIFGGKRYD